VEGSGPDLFEGSVTAFFMEGLSTIMKTLRISGPRAGVSIGGLLTTSSCTTKLRPSVMYLFTMCPEMLPAECGRVLPPAYATLSADDSISSSRLCYRMCSVSEILPLYFAFIFVFFALHY